MLIAFCAMALYSAPISAGGWAADTLSNDDASDFFAQIAADGGVELIHSALDAALTHVSPVDDERASRALAAAEMVAAMMGNPSPNLVTPCKEWAALHSKAADQDLIWLAVRAVDRVVEDSEAKELIQEGGAKNLLDWQMSVTNLKARLISRRSG